MVCSLKTNLFQYEVIDSSCNETERYPYANGYSVTVFASVKQARRYYRISWSNQHFNFFFFLSKLQLVYFSFYRGHDFELHLAK